MAFSSLYRALEHVSDAIVAVDAGGTIQFANAAARAIFSHPQGGLTGQAIDDLLPGLSRQHLAPAQPTFLEIPYRPPPPPAEKDLPALPNGNVISLKVEIVPLEPVSSGPSGALLCIQNASRKAFTEEQLRLQSAALEAAANAILITDMQGTIVWVNPAFTRLTGYPAAEALGRNPRFLNAGYHDRQFYKNLWDTMIAGRVWQGVMFNRRKDGRRYIEEMTITPVHSPEGRISHFIAIKQDISERVQEEKKLKRLYVAEHEQRLLAEALHQVSTELSLTLDTDEILDHLLEQIRTVVPYDSACVLLVDGKQVRVARQRGYERYGEASASQIAAQTFDLKSLSHLQEMAQRGGPMAISDTATSSSWVPYDSGVPIRSWVGAPIMVQGQAMAFFSLDKREPGFYQPKHARQLAAFAGQAALAIQNAHLYKAGKRRIQALEALRATVADISGELELPRLLRAALERAYELLGAAGGELGLYDEERQEIEIVASHYLGKDYTGLRLSLGEGLMGYIAQSRQPMIVEDYDRWEGRSDKYQGVSIHAIIGAPMLTGNRLVGAITVADPNLAKHFTQADLNLLNLFAQQAAIAVENARLFEAAQRRAQEAETLRQAGALVAASLQQEDAITRILEQLARVVPYDRASVQLLRDGYLEVVGGRGWDDPEGILGRRFLVPGENPHTRVIQNQEPQLLAHPDIHQLPGHEATQSWLGVPLVVGGRVIGMLAVDSRQPGHFNADHARLATAFADQVAVALENARLFESERRRAEELAVLNAIALASATATDEDTLIARAIQEILQIIPCDLCCVMLLDKRGGSLRPHPASHLPAGTSLDVSVPAGEGYFGQVVREGQARLIADIRQEPTESAWAPGMRARLCAPLKMGAQVMGVVLVEAARANAYNQSSEKMLLSFTSQLATGIERVRLYKEALEAAERRSVLYRASQEIGASLHPDQIYRAIHNAARRLMPCEIFVIALVDTGGNEIETPYLFERGKRYPARRFPLEHGLSGYVITTGKPLLSDNFEGTHGGAFEVETFGESQERGLSVLAVPMRLGRQVIGMLSAQSPEHGAYSIQDQEALELLATQAAIALNNARLFQETRRQLDELVVLHAVALAGAEATSEDALLDKATRLVGTTLYPDNFGILLLDETGENLRIHPSYRGLRSEVLGDASAFRIPLGKGICGSVAMSGKPWRVPDVKREPAYMLVDPNMRSELCVPLKTGNRVIGVVNAESARLDAFSEADERLLATFASQLATAIAKVRLFEEVQQLAILDSLTEVYNRRHLFELAEHEFQRALRYERPLSAIMVDIDRFKRVNDRFGHAVGDRVLRSVAQSFRHALREIDILGRYGGEEFVAFLPESDLESARQAAMRLCRTIADQVFEANGKQVKVTASLGVAAVDASCTDLDELLRRADQALYQAKQAGRNQVSAWE